MRNHILNKPDQLDDNDPLKKYEGFINDLSLYTVEGTGKDVLVKNGVELIIPESSTKEIVEMLHETHLSAA